MPPHTLHRAPLAAALACACATLAATPSAIAAATDFSHPHYALRLEQRRLPASSTRAPVPHGSTLPVSNCLDDGSAGTLRSVLAGAAEGDVVDLSALTCGTITLTQGLIDLSVLGTHPVRNLTLVGPGRDDLAIDAGGDRAFAHGDFQTGLGTLTLRDLTLRNGAYTHGLASCIRSSGNVVLERVTITGCHASGGGPLTFGGAIDVSGSLTMRSSTISASSSSAAGDNVAIGGGAYVMGDAELVDSTISGNSVSAAIGGSGDGYYLTAGGGLYVRGDLTMTGSTISGNAVDATDVVDGAIGGGVFVRGVATITSSTIDNNSAASDGGGLFKAVFSVFGDPPPPQDTHLSVGNSTISGNTAVRGGGIATTRPLRLSNSTVASNTGLAGGGGVMFRLDGVYDSEGTLDLRSSIVAANGTGPSPAFAADLAADGVLTVTGAHDLVTAADAAIALPADTIALAPELFPLAWNGGPTRTHALAADSPARDAGDNDDALAFDQRGTNFARVSGSSTDIGAFEAQQPVSDTIFEDGFDGSIVPIPVDHAYDDGDGDTNQGPPSSFDPDMLWGNYYTAAAGGEVITRISVAFGPTFPSLANGPVTFWLLEDGDDDGDPRNAHAIASVTGTPTVFNDTFFEIAIPPTFVQGGFFVGASAKLDGGADKPARVDTGASGHDSWFFYAPDVAATIDDLASAPFGTRNDNPAYVILPGAFMVRAYGTEVP